MKTNVRIGFYSSLVLTILTILTFSFAIIAVPSSGPYCSGDCMSYPYSDLLKYFPRDYYWMYLILFQLCALLILIIANHFSAKIEKQIYSFISISFCIIAVTILLANYFIQFSVIPVSIMKNENEGIALLTQYNAHGIFIVLEEIGFILMSIAFLFNAPLFNNKNRLEKAMRWIYPLPFIGTLFFFILYTLSYGIVREYRFEIATISMNWIGTIVIGILTCFYYKKAIHDEQ